MQRLGSELLVVVAVREMELFIASGRIGRRGIGGWIALSAIISGSSIVFAQSGLLARRSSHLREDFNRESANKDAGKSNKQMKFNLRTKTNNSNAPIGRE